MGELIDLSKVDQHIFSISYSVLFYYLILFVSLSQHLTEALAHPGWQDTMKEEMVALEQNHTFVSLQPQKRAIGRKWLFANKMNPDASVSRMKARLVANGYAQTQGVDYS